MRVLHHSPFTKRFDVLSRGGRTIAPTIDNDGEWASARLRLGKNADIRLDNGEKLPLFAAFDTTEMESFLVQTRVCRIYCRDLFGFTPGRPPVDAHAAILSTRVSGLARIHSFGHDTEPFTTSLDHRSPIRRTLLKQTECKARTLWLYRTQTNALNPVNTLRRMGERELAFNCWIGIFRSICASSRSGPQLW